MKFLKSWFEGNKRYKEDIMKITDILKKESVKLELEANNKETLLQDMVELAKESGKISNPEEALKELHKREAIMSTGVGKGIALPHAKTNSVEDSVGALTILKNPVNFNSLDGKPVEIAFMLLGRENNVGNHLRLLSKISRLMNNDPFRKKLMSAESPDEVI